MAAPPGTISRPSFARGFPTHDALDALVEAFVRGNYARVRNEAPRLVDSAEPDDVRQSARVLLERTKPDPLAVRLLILTGALLLALTAYWTINGKPPAPAAGVPMERIH